MEAFRSLRNTRPPHFYTQDGEARYEVPTADGRGTKAATIQDARRHGWLPSVTTILKMWPRPALEIYKRRQDLLAAMTATRQPGEGDEAFCDRVIKDSEEHANTAAAFGTHCHRLFEFALVGEMPQPEELLGPAMAWFPYLEEWCRKTVQKVHWREKILINRQLGYGGRADALVEMEGQQVLIDPKTQGIKKAPAFYGEWVMQLVAEAQALEEPFALRTPLASIVIDSGKPSAPILFIWSDDEKIKAWDDFLACFKLWCRVKEYQPPTLP